MSDTDLTAAEIRDLRLLAGIMIPASEEFGVPGADDAAIFVDMLGSLGRDRSQVCAALGRFADLCGDGAPDQAAAALLAEAGSAVATLGRVILQCYYRDDRVIRSLGLEPRPPFPLGHILEQGDWSLLDPVRARPKLWRDAP